MHEASTYVDTSTTRSASGAEDAVYIGSRSSISVSAVIGRSIRNILFLRWKAQAVNSELSTLLSNRHDFIIGDYPLKKLSRKNANGRVLLRRNGALGDVIVLFPAIRRLKELLPFTYSLACGAPYTQLFRHDQTFDEVVCAGSKNKLPIIGEIRLDGVLERDLAWDTQHNGPNPEFLVPRIFAYFDFLAQGFSLPMRFKPDYSIKTGEQDAIWAKQFVEGIKERQTKPILIVQARGSGPVRSLGRERMIAITKRLSEKYAIVVVDQSRQYAWKDEDKGIDCAYGRPLLNLVELMRRSDIALVMDSGLQWIAHMAAIPMVSVLGPTRASERIVTHPLYPEGAKAINAATLYGCSPCYENARKCKWQYECLRKQNTEILGTAIENAIYEVLKNGTGRSNDQVIG